MKIRPVGAELFNADGRTDGQTDMKLTVAFSKFCERAYNGIIMSQLQRTRHETETDKLTCRTYIICYM